MVRIKSTLNLKLTMFSLSLLTHRLHWNFLSKMNLHIKIWLDSPSSFFSSFEHLLIRANKTFKKMILFLHFFDWFSWDDNDCNQLRWWIMISYHQRFVKYNWALGAQGAHKMECWKKEKLPGDHLWKDSFEAPSSLRDGVT